MAKVDGPTTGDELPDSDGPATTGAAAELEGAGGVGGGGDPTSDGEGRGCSLFSSVQLETDTLWQSAASISPCVFVSLYPSLPLMEYEILILCIPSFISFSQPPPPPPHQKKINRISISKPSSLSATRVRGAN